MNEKLPEYPSVLPFLILISSATVLIFIGFSCSGSVVTESMLDAIERVESGVNVNAHTLPT